MARSESDNVAGHLAPSHLRRRVRLWASQVGSQPSRCGQAWLRPPMGDSRGMGGSHSRRIACLHHLAAVGEESSETQGKQHQIRQGCSTRRLVARRSCRVRAVREPHEHLLCGKEQRPIHMRRRSMPMGRPAVSITKSKTVGNARRRIEKLEAADEIAQRVRELFDEGYRLPDIADQLNREGYCPARGEKYTKTSVGALCRKLRRLGMIARHPAVKPNYWRPSSLAKRLGVKRSTLSGWCRRGWVQSQQVGGRRMYWADQPEMKRLEQLAVRDRTGFKMTPRELTTAVSRMPEC